MVPFDARTWAIESAGGLGYPLAQQLVAAGEHVVDVPATLSARVRVLGSGRSSKNDPNDALSAAIAALRHPSLRIVTTEDHATVLRMLAIRHHDLTGLRTQAICRLHALLAAMVPGGAGRRRLTAAQATKTLRRVRPLGAVEVDSMDHARALLHDVRRLEHELATVKDRITTAVAAAGTSVTDVPGVGPIIACLLIGHSNDITRFASRDHYASYTGTAPIEAPADRGSDTGATPEATASSTMRSTWRPSPSAPRRPRPRLLRPQTRRRQEPKRSAASTETPYRRRRLPTPHPRRSPTPLNQRGPGGHPGAALQPRAAGFAP